MIRGKLPELLAPAGNLECALAAFESGADAVYAGLSKFNAREKSDNFTLDQMSKLSYYARKHKKKIYLTLNTLVKERELEEIYRDLEEISRLAVDAVIVQDIGVVHLIKTFFPEISLHASTQMGIHNSEGVKLAESMGIDRVILERQVTIDELAMIAEVSPLELEVFIHGALCCSLSGNCLFSSWIGGWSGNRGKCKQPCRRRYYSKSEGNGFFFSTRDLYTLDMIPELKETGVASLKIEGRLKNADYVGRTVTAYRMILDAAEGTEKELMGKAKNILAGSAGRKWSSGFYTNESLKTVVDHTSIGVSGQLCGELTDISGKGITVKVSREIKIGDRLRIQPRSADEGPRITVTAMKAGKRTVEKARRNEHITILLSRDSVKETLSPGSLVFKVGQTPRKLSVNPEEIPFLPDLRIFNLKVKISRKGIVVGYSDFPDAEPFIRTAIFDTAEKHRLTPDTVVSFFTATRDERIKAGIIEVSIEGDLFIPSGVLKKIRRDFWEQTAERLETDLRPDKSRRNITAYMQYHYSTRKEEDKSTAHPGTKKTRMIHERNNRIPVMDSDDLKSVSIFHQDTCSDEVFLPVFTPEGSLDDIKNLIDTAYSNGMRRFRARSLYQINILKQYPDLYVTAAYPLPVSNSFAARELAKIGVSCIQGWVELEKPALEDLVMFNPLDTEIYRYGRPHVLVTRAEIKTEGEITDSHGVAFMVKKDKHEGITFLYGRKVMSIPAVFGTSECLDLINADPEEKDITSFNFFKDWV